MVQQVFKYECRLWNFYYIFPYGVEILRRKYCLLCNNLCIWSCTNVSILEIVCSILYCLTSFISDIHFVVTYTYSGNIQIMVSRCDFLGESAHYYFLYYSFHLVDVKCNDCLCWYTGSHFSLHIWLYVICSLCARCYTSPIHQNLLHLISLIVAVYCLYLSLFTYLHPSYFELQLYYSSLHCSYIWNVRIIWNSFQIRALSNLHIYWIWSLFHRLIASILYNYLSFSFILLYFLSLNFIFTASRIALSLYYFITCFYLST